jgi:ribosome-associated toxin RatA of RatAB toxin-antitoxin module
MPYVEVNTTIKGDIKRIWAIVSDMASYPQFMPNLKTVTIEERAGNTTVSKWVSNVDGRIISWRERDVFFPDDYRIEYTQVSGDLKKFEGKWQLSPDGETVNVLLTVDFEFGVPMLAALLNPLLKKKVRENSEGMLAAIKKICEETHA